MLKEKIIKIRRKKTKTDGPVRMSNTGCRY